MGIYTRADLRNSYIYFLLDPRNNKVRYIGITNDPKNRLDMHIRNKEAIKESPKRKWIERLAKEGLYPTMLLVARFESRVDCEKVERQLIWEFSERQKIYNSKHTYREEKPGTILHLSKLI